MPVAAHHSPAPSLDWRNDSLCARVAPELFFPVGSGEPAQEQVLAAKAVCARCPVLETCRAWALNARIREGVWGGLDEAERKELLRAGSHP